ncbi:MAG TPA: FkbM family methyltransferase, partial [Acidobacteriaceae bacterium]|nr:FkbM family methyltransferase [Acidobacteriaceae bacterium]
VVDEEQVASIDLLKIDVELSEREVLDGIREEHWQRIQQVVMEVTDKDHALRTIEEMLHARGFSVATEQEPRLKGTAVYNLFATKRAG